MWNSGNQGRRFNHGWTRMEKRGIQIAKGLRRWNGIGTQRTGRDNRRAQRGIKRKGAGLHEHSRGGKGPGRLVCLQACQRVEGQSVHTNGNGCELRKFVLQCEEPEIREGRQPAEGETAGSHKADINGHQQAWQAVGGYRRSQCRGKPAAGGRKAATIGRSRLHGGMPAGGLPWSHQNEIHQTNQPHPHSFRRSRPDRRTCVARSRKNAGRSRCGIQRQRASTRHLARSAAGNSGCCADPAATGDAWWGACSTAARNSGWCANTSATGSAGWRLVAATPGNPGWCAAARPRAAGRKITAA